jgi:hypothetical protein
MAIILKDRMHDLDLHSAMDCRQILSLKIQGSLGSSSRKYVEKLEEGGNSGYSFSDQGYRKM